MKTTNILIEMLTLGLFGSAWVFLFVNLGNEDIINQFHDSLSKLPVALVIFILFIVLNQLGWLIGWISYSILNLWGSKIKNKLFTINNLDYEKIRASVYNDSSEQLRNDLGVDRMVVRLARGGIFNFFLIFVGLLLNGYYLNSIFAILLTVLFTIQWYFRFKRYHKRMINAYVVISNKKT